MQDWSAIFTKSENNDSRKHYSQSKKEKYHGVIIIAGDSVSLLQETEVHLLVRYGGEVQLVVALQAASSVSVQDLLHPQEFSNLVCDLLTNLALFIHRSSASFQSNSRKAILTHTAFQKFDAMKEIIRAGRARGGPAPPQNCRPRCLSPSTTETQNHLHCKLQSLNH